MLVYMFMVSIVRELCFLETTKLAKKKTPAAGPRKSDVIREILKSQSKATVKDVRLALEERGVKASDALINKIKYGRKPAAKKTRGSNGSGGSKADAIRGLFEEMGVNTRARDIVATLLRGGIKVTPAQVSTLRKRRWQRPCKGRDGLLGLARALNGGQGLGQQLGGIAVAKRALESLAKLTDN